MYQGPHQPAPYPNAEDCIDWENRPALTFNREDISVCLNCRGSRDYTKISYPVKYGLFSRIETGDLILEFNQNHEIRHARSKTAQWLHPSEWLKRTAGNDWIYYSTGGYAGVFESIGEYYLPNLMYTTNSLLGGRPFETPEVARLANNWHDIIADILKRLAPAFPAMPGPVAQWVRAVGAVTPEGLAERADRLFRINGERTTVLPPDARHSDYDIIPVTIADGCLYKCRFCKVKNKKAFTPRSEENILAQLKALKHHYHKDRVNYNSLFLGEHDALNAPADLIVYTARTAWEILDISKSYMKKPMLYLFGSVDALLNQEERLFKALNSLPFHTCINIGLESADPETLDRIGKPLTPRKVCQAFDRLLEVNARYPKVEITCNFIMDQGLPAGHIPAMMDLVRERAAKVRPKGAVYLSPLRFGRPSREVLFDFYRLKTQSRLPMYLYIIQRL